MKTYIRATGNISPQHTFGHPPFPDSPVFPMGNRFTCIEPDYKASIDLKMLRRMSRILKMGVAAAADCLQEAQLAAPEAIITGTAYGCLEDTVVFLSKMVQQQETLLTPTAFIQSTHNTVGAQIALMLHCHGYNNTFVHRGASFESALLDGMLLLQEKEVANVLVGGVDEITETSHTLLSRFGLYKREATTAATLYASGTRGTIGGEGAAFFLLTGMPSENDYCILEGLQTFYNASEPVVIAAQVAAFLALHHSVVADLDLVITGRNGDPQHDAPDNHSANDLFAGVPLVNYKHLCGEYPTAIAFAVWLAAGIIRSNTLPIIVGKRAAVAGGIKKVLLYNRDQNDCLSLVLLSAC